MKQMIKEVINGEEKRSGYAILITRNNEAINQGFFFESVLIEYALIEDRLDSLLWAAGVLNDIGGKYSVGNKKNKEQLRSIYFRKYPDKKQIVLQNISVKSNMIRALIDFANIDLNINDRYLTLLKEALSGIDLKGLSDILDQLELWISFRNEIIHDSARKNIKALIANAEKCAKEGITIFRKIDNESDKLSRYTNIRKAINMPSVKSY